MKRTARTILISAILSAACAFSAAAQSTFEGKVQVDKTVHDFGDISVSDGPVSCTYTFTNNSSKAMLILNVVTSCGCTDVTWTREPIPVGKTGTVTATFDNNDGPYPFDKTVTAYVSELSKPVVLHLRGVAHQSAKPLKERYTLMFGNFGVRDLEMNAGNFVTGEKKTVEFTVANNGVAPMKVEFQNVSEGMKLSVFPNPVPAKSTATLECTITSTGRKFGKNWYYATPVVDGRVFKAVGKLPVKEDDGSHVYRESNSKLGLGKSEIGIYAVTKARSLAYENEADAPSVSFTKSTQSFGKVAAGAKASVSYELKNGGKEALELYKLDTDCSKVTVKKMDEKVGGGQKSTINVELNTQGMPKGENIIVLNLYTNDPLRPVVTLQLVGEIQ